MDPSPASSPSRQGPPRGRGGPSGHLRIPRRPAPHEIAAWLHNRTTRHLGADQARRQRRLSLFLLIFGLIRMTAWCILGVIIVLGLAHLEALSWAKQLAESVPFVVLVSIYANIATDLDQVCAAFAALVAADAHLAAETARQVLAGAIESVGDDIVRLAQLQPCQEADDLAASIRNRLHPVGAQPGA